MKKKIFYTSLRTFSKLSDPYYQGAAAELGFYFIFSIIPIITLMLQALSVFDLAQELFAGILASFEEDSTVVMIASSIQDALESNGISILFIVVALWSASKLHFSMIRIANYTYGIEQKPVTGYFQTRIRAVVTILFFILLVSLSLVILVYGNMLLQVANTLLLKYLNMTINLPSWLFNLLRWPIALVAYFFMLALNFKMLPNKKVTMKETIPGSIFAAIGIIVVTLIYNIYFRYFSNINLIYGSLAAIIALLLWFYMISYILVIAVVINAEWLHGEKRETQAA